MATPRKPSPRPQSPSRPAPATRPARTTAAAGAKSTSGSRPKGPRGAGARAEARSGSRTAARPAAPSRTEHATSAGPPPAVKKRPAPLGPPPVLTTRQRSHLRGLGHHLAPVVQVGKEGLTEALCNAIGVALLRHELIKLRLAESVEGDRHELAAEIANRSHAALVQVLGRTLLLYRPRPDEDGADAGAPRPHVTLH